MSYLIFADHQSEIERRELYANSAALVVGRSADCDVPVRDTLLSRRHCRFDSLGDRWVVTDLKSKNGTRVDGRPIERHVLRDGEVIRAGRTRICFRAGAFQPAPPGTQRRRDERPADPVEALAGTVAGFHLGDMEEDSKASGFPIPRPRPAEPAAYGRENVGAMVAQLASSSWDRTTAKNRTAPARRGNTIEVIERQRSSIQLVRPLAPHKWQPATIEDRPITRDRTISRWQVVISIGLAIGVCAASLAVLAMAWLTRAPAR